MRSAVLLSTLVFAGCQFTVAGDGASADPGGGATTTSPIEPPSAPAAPMAAVDAATPVDAAHADDMARVAEMAPPLAPKLMVGAACKTTQQCGGDLVCVQQLGLGKESSPFPAGYCTRDCAKTACPTGSACRTIGGAEVCLAECPHTTSCRDGYRCCATDAVCAPNNSCS